MKNWDSGNISSILVSEIQAGTDKVKDRFKFASYSVYNDMTYNDPRWVSFLCCLIPSIFTA